MRPELADAGEKAAIGPNPVSTQPQRSGASKPQSRDVLIGAAVAARRRRLGVTQVEVARALGVAPQQLQKYESGINRLSASRLYDVALILNCEVSDFFGGVIQARQDGVRPARAVASLLKSVYGPIVADRFSSLPPSSQRKVVGLLAPLARTLTEGVAGVDAREVQPVEAPDRPPVGPREGRAALDRRATARSSGSDGAPGP